MLLLAHDKVKKKTSGAMITWEADQIWMQDLIALYNTLGKNVEFISFFFLSYLSNCD